MLIVCDRATNLGTSSRDDESPDVENIDVSFETSSLRCKLGYLWVPWWKMCLSVWKSQRLKSQYGVLFFLTRTCSLPLAGEPSRTSCSSGMYIGGSAARPCGWSGSCCCSSTCSAVASWPNSSNRNVGSDVAIFGRISLGKSGRTRHNRIRVW
jgi:hypothetical protein